MGDDLRGTGELLVTRWFLYYCIALLALAGTAALADGVDAPILTVSAYLASGYGLNRVVLSQLEFNPLHETIDAVVRTKLSMFLFWPIAYPILLVKLIIIKFL